MSIPTMSTSKFVDEFCAIIDTYGGRDKVMKTLCYSAKLIAGYHATRNPEVSKRYAIASSRISGARATLRLIDDIPMIQYALEYGIGSKEPDGLTALLGVTANIVDLLYYPIEKICWLSEHKIVNVKYAERWDLLNSVFWVLSVYLNLMRILRNFAVNQQKINSTKLAQHKFDDKALKKHRLELISLLRLSLDFTHAVSTLPKGYLWGGKLSTFQVGCIGTFSAVLGLYQIFAKRRL